MSNMKDKILVKRKIIAPVPITAMKKMVLLVLGGILFLGAVTTGFFQLKPKISTREEVLYTYKAVADAAYRVKLLPNTLFEQTWMEAGGVYSSQLTEYIEVSFQAHFEGSSGEEVLGEYEITGVVEGYQEVKDAKKTIYERRFPMKTGKLGKVATGSADIKEVVTVNPQTFRQTADEAESILGGSANRRFYLLFEGVFSSDTQYGKAEEPFSLELQIPIPKTTGLYEIELPQEVSKTGTITTSNEIREGARPLHILLITAWGMLSLLPLLGTLRFTRKPNEAEAYEMQWKDCLRRYGSRMIQLMALEENSLEGAIEVGDMYHLVMLSEELHQPICYCLEENGLPQKGMLFILSEKNSYFFKLEKVTTSLEVEKGAEGSTLSS